MSDDPDSVLNHATSTRDLVQAHTIHGGVHFHDPATVEEMPLIVSVEDRTALSHLIVDDNPPRRIAESGRTHVVVTVEARSAQAVILEGLRPLVLDRRTPRLASSDEPISSAYGIEIRYIDVDLTAEELGIAAADLEFTADLDTDSAGVQARTRSSVNEAKCLVNGGFPYKVTASDPERFVISPYVKGHEIAWELHLNWLCAGRHGTTIINNNGEPFQLYPDGIAITHIREYDRPSETIPDDQSCDARARIRDLWDRYHGQGKDQ